MIENRLKDALLKELGHMPPTLQQQVLTFASSLNRQRPQGTPIRDLLQFAGTISREDGEAMLKSH